MQVGFIGDLDRQLVSYVAFPLSTDWKNRYILVRLAQRSRRLLVILETASVAAAHEASWADDDEDDDDSLFATSRLIISAQVSLSTISFGADDGETLR